MSMCVARSVVVQVSCGVYRNTLASSGGWGTLLVWWVRDKKLCVCVCVCVQGEAASTVVSWGCWDSPLLWRVQTKKRASDNIHLPGVMFMYRVCACTCVFEPSRMVRVPAASFLPSLGSVCRGFLFVKRDGKEGAESRCGTGLQALKLGLRASKLLLKA